MWLDVCVIAVYMAVVITLGLSVSRASSMKDYFLGGKTLHWLVACFSIVATETSALTFISVPGIAYIRGVGFLQIAFGYILGRILVAFILLPKYFSGDIETTYHFLQKRFGVSSRRVLAVIFHITRLLAEAIRLFCGAIPLALLLGFGDSYTVPILIIGVSSLVYAYVGGIKSVAVVDTFQLILYLVCAFTGMAVIVTTLDLPLAEIIRRIPPDHVRIFSSGLESGARSLFGGYNIFSGIIGGALLSFASHGTDQLLVQRVLSCRDLKSARKAMIGSGIVVCFQFAVFLVLGLLIRVLYDAREFPIPDQILPTFIIEQIPHGLRGLMLAGVFAVSMCTISSAINSLSSSTVLDLLRLSEKQMPEKRKVQIARMFSLFWTAALIAIAMMFRDTRSPLVELVLGIASVTSGGMLGIFVTGVIFREFNEKAAIAGVIVSVCAVGAVYVLDVLRVISVFWPWFVPMGLFVSMATGMLANAVMRRKGSPAQ